MSDSNNCKVLFLHIPKTAGTMMSSILRANFKKKFHQDHLVYADIYYEPWQVIDTFRIVPYQCIASHALRAISLPDVVDDVIAFAFVRNPIELAISCYFDLRNRVSGSQHPTQHMEMDELTKQWKSSGFNQEFAYSVSQINWLYPNITNKLGQLEKDLKLKRIHLFPSEKFDETMVCLEQIYPQYFSDCSYGIRSNVSVKDIDVEERHLNSINSLPWIQDDLELWRAGQSYLSQLQNDIFSSVDEQKKALENYRLRCSNKLKTDSSLKFKNRSLFKSLLKRMLS